MDPIFIFCYVALCGICFNVYIFENWFRGADTTISDIFAMALTSIAPIINIVILFSSIMTILETVELDNKARKFIVLKGRTK